MKTREKRNGKNENVIRKTDEKRPSVSVNRDNGKKKSRHTVRQQQTRNRIITVVMVMILMAICCFISLKVLFIVQKVEVVGTERYTEEDILAFCNIPYELNIFDVDTKSYEESLPENFTYIDSADVQRKYPNKIRIVITDCVPTYYSSNGEEGDIKYTIYSQNFKKLTEQAAKPLTLMGIYADLDNREIKSTIQNVIKAIDKYSYENISSICIKSESDIQIVYEDRLVIETGSILDIDYKLKMAYKLINDEIPDKESGIIDVRNKGKAVYKMNG